MKFFWLLALALSVSCADNVSLAPVPADNDNDNDNDVDDEVTIDAGSPVVADAGRDAAAEAGPTVPTPTGERVRVATFNVRLFFDPTCDSGDCGPGSFESAPTRSEFEERAAEIAAALETLGADVIALQEIENQECLDALGEALRDRGLAYPVAVLGETNFTASIDVAVLAKGELLDVTTHADTPLPLPSGGTTRFARELLEVRVKLGSVTVDMFAAHFRSKNNDDPERRLAEGRAAGAIVARAAADRPTEYIVLGGDLNDTPGSAPLEALESAGDLLRLASDRPLDAQGTHTFNGNNEAIDHLYGAAAARTAAPWPCVTGSDSAAAITQPCAPIQGFSKHHTSDEVTCAGGFLFYEWSPLSRGGAYRDAWSWRATSASASATPVTARRTPCSST